MGNMNNNMNMNFNVLRMGCELSKPLISTCLNNYILYI